MQKLSNEPQLLARVEEVCLNAWPALQEVHYDGWLIRFADGHTRRVNSVNVLRAGSIPVGEKIAYCEALYHRHGSRPYFRILSTADDGLEEALAARGYRAEDETLTLYMDFAGRGLPKPDFSVELDVHGPSAEWLEAYARFHSQGAEERATLKKILRQLALPGVYGIVRDETGAVRSIAKGAVHDHIASLNMVATDGAARRRGYSRACVSAILAWALREENATGACLQVVAANTPAIALYERLGFTQELYRYHYRTL
jgi:ribosomal protein S18 acetylase RimI-like enzyme